MRRIGQDYWMRRIGDETYMCHAYSRKSQRAPINLLLREEFEQFAIAAGLPSLTGALFAHGADRAYYECEQNIRFMFLEFMALMLDDEQQT